MKTLFAGVLGVMVSLVPLAASAEAGQVVLRGDANVDVDQTLNLGGDNGDVESGGTLSFGVGYFVLDGLSVDVDVNTGFQLAPALGFTSLGLTPGARWYPVEQIYVRAGAPVVFLPDYGFGVLGGVGYVQPLGGNASLVLGADYTWWLTPAFRAEAPGGRVQLHGGVQLGF